MRKELGIQDLLFESFDGTKIGYQRVGEGATTIVLCNGLGGSIYAWKHIVERFKDRFQFLCYDYRGFFESQRPENPAAITVEDHVKDLVALLEHEQVDGDVIVFGWSMGVQIALEYTYRFQERVKATVLFSGTYGRVLSTAFEIPGAEVIMPLVVGGMRESHVLIEMLIGAFAETEFAIKALKCTPLVGRQLDEELFGALAAGFKTFDMRYYFDLMFELDRHTTEHYLDKIETPTLIVHGEFDLMTPHSVTSLMLNKMPRSSMITIPGGTHYCIVEYPEIVNLKLEEFLAPHMPKPTAA